MEIHVVAQGDTLYDIARRYQVTPQEIVTSNRFTHPNQLIIGETLLIPSTNRYTVQAGETFWSIAQKFNIDVQALMSLNQPLTHGVLHAGQVIRIPEKQKPKMIVNGFIEPSAGAVQQFQEAADGLTYVGIFSYHVKANGDLVAPNDTEDALLEAAKSRRVFPLMTITNISTSGFDREVAAALFKSSEAQNRLLNNVLRIMKEKGYRGLIIDFEYLGSGTRRAFNRFIKKMTDRLHQERYIVCTALAPKISGEQTGAWYEAHDYQFHGKTVDFVILMTYEWGWSGGPPMPVSPLTQVETVVNYARSVMPDRKIVVSIPLYGYDWTLPYEPGGPFAKALSFEQTLDLARRHHVQIEFNEKEKAPYFRYTDQQNRSHIVFFEDLRTMEALFQLVRSHHLRGLSFWNLAFRFPEVWALITDEFNVKK